MTFKQFIDEAYWNSFKEPKGATADVYKNPSREETATLMGDLRRRYGNQDLLLKALISGKDMYMWGGEFLHEQMSRKLNIFGGRLIPIYPEPKESKVYISTIMMHGQGFTTYNWHEDSDIIEHEIRSNPALRRIMTSFELATV